MTIIYARPRGKTGRASLAGRPCEAYVAPIDVFSPGDSEAGLGDYVYERNDVREYWAIRPHGAVFVWTLSDGRYAPAREYLPDMALPSAVLEGFEWPSRLSLLEKKSLFP